LAVTDLVSTGVGTIRGAVIPVFTRIQITDQITARIAVFQTIGGVFSLFGVTDLVAAEAICRAVLVGFATLDFANIITAEYAIDGAVVAVFSLIRLAGSITAKAILGAVGIHFANIYLTESVAAFGDTIARAIGAIFGFGNKKLTKIAPTIPTIHQTILRTVFSAFFKIQFTDTVTANIGG